MEKKSVLIFGATGNIGGAATRELLKRGWHVRATTRDLKSDKAQALKTLGAEVIQADMEDQDSLEAAFDGIRRVFSVQNWVTSGTDGEIRQGKLVADVALSVEVEHLVYGSAGTGEANTGVPHFQSKLEVEDYMRELGLPFTIIRPGPFMELLTQKEFFPALASWGVEPKIVGWDTPLPWVAVQDIGMAIANVLEDPEVWIGQDISLIGDVKTLGECKEVFATVDGKNPLRVPLPVWLFGKMASNEFIQMWKWLVNYIAVLGINGLRELVENSKEVCPEMLDMENWLKITRNGHRQASPTG